MPRQIICSNQKKTLMFDPNTKIKFPPEICGGTFFQNVMQLVILSPFESKTGGIELQMQPGFKCLDCGAVLDVNEELKK